VPRKDGNSLVEYWDRKMIKRAADKAQRGKVLRTL